MAFLSDARYEGGAERYLVRLAGGLDRDRFAPVLLLPEAPNLDGLAARAGARAVPVIRYPAGGAQGSLSGALARTIHEAAADLVHINLPSTYELACGWAALTARRAGARAVVTTEHIADIPRSRRRALLKRIAFTWINTVIAISNTHRRLLIERHGVPVSRIRVIYNGVEDPGSPAGRPSGEPPVILCAGVLEDRKGQDVLIDALAGLRDRGLEARLVLVGDGPQRSSLEEQVRTRGISAQVRFTGRLESIDGELSVADILAVPSRIEGLPFVILEGMAAGIAVLASSLPGIEEVVSPGRTGILAAPGNSTAWTDALARLMTDPATSARLAAEGRREFEKRFTLQRMVRETTSVYEEALG